MVSKSATTPGYALSVRYNQKNRLYFNACKAVGLVFVPLPIESLGSWHPDAAQVISRLGSMVAEFRKHLNLPANQILPKKPS